MFSAGRQLVFTGTQSSSKLDFFLRETFSRWSKQTGKVIPTADQNAQCPALNETPGQLSSKLLS